MFQIIRETLKNPFQKEFGEDFSDKTLNLLRMRDSQPCEDRKRMQGKA